MIGENEPSPEILLQRIKESILFSLEHDYVWLMTTINLWQLAISVNQF